jgi:serine/threonine protein phosphatase 1
VSTPRTFVIGDVHGCIEELKELIGSFRLVPEDTVIFAGDLIHKGPDSVAVLAYVASLGEFCTVKVVAGNHEEKQLRYIRNEKKARLTGSTNPMKHTEGYAEIWDNSPPELIELMENSRLYVEAEGFLVLHGGLAPRASLEDVAIKDLGTLASDVRERAKWILFTRYVTPYGTPVSLGQETEVDKYWAETYDGWAGHILFGHQPFLEDQAKTFDHATGLDLGCVYGNLLCGVEISDSKIVRNFYVKAHRQYDHPYFED